MVETQREKAVLGALVEEFIKTASPVSSGVLHKKYLPNISSALIRNVLASLEEQGYLWQPHTSSGRMPTEKGFRCYINILMKPSDLPSPEKDGIKKSLEDGLQGPINRALRKASKTLSAHTHLAAVALAPEMEKLKLKSIHFVKIKEKEVLAVIISTEGIIHNLIVEIPEHYSQEDLDKFNRYMEEHASGLTLRELQERIVDHMKIEKTAYEDLLRKVVAAAETLEENAKAELSLVLEGEMNLLDAPEFASIEQLKEIYQAFEQKGKLLKLLDKTLRSDGVKVFIGTEIFDGNVGLGLVTATYKCGEAAGTLGVLGPLRMNYRHIIPLVEYTAEILSSLHDDGEQ